MTQATVESVTAALDRGDPAGARERLLTVLDALAASGDTLAATCARVLRQAPFAPDRLAEETDRLLAIVGEQDRQIEALMALVDARL